MNKQQLVEFTNVKITDGFWKHRQQMNAKTTIHAVRSRFEETGRFDAYEGHWREGMPNKPYLWLTGDVEKWIEAVAYLRHAGECEELEALCDTIIDNIERNQLPDGYYNMWVLQENPTQRWAHRDWHELFAIGHLIEAAIAYHNATGKDKLLRCACRAADHVEEVFVKHRAVPFFTPGHEEIELALVKLYRHTGEQRYLELSKYFVDERGKHTEDLADNVLTEQSHAPVRQQYTAEGHAVRGTYLYSAMADLAREYKEKELLNACQKIFDNIRTRRMYVTGGIGSTAKYEGFTIDYDLPNLTAYSESCAAIGLMMFAQRMQLVDADAKYADVIEQVLYNGFLSSTSLDGSAFFYENPLEIDPKLTNREPYLSTNKTRMPITQRVKVFDVSCCPPNIARTVASIGNYLYTYNDSCVFLQQFMDSEATFEINGKPITIVQKTVYPVNGSVRIQTQGINRLAIRIPSWCDKWSIEIADKQVDCVLQKGYAYVDCSLGEIKIEFDMTPYAIEASPHVQDNSGRAAIRRGPVLYCLEGVDNGVDLRDVHIDLSHPITVRDCDFCGLPTLSAKGWRRDARDFENALYRRKLTSYQEQELRLVPYYAFANRGETEMIVWILT